MRQTEEQKALDLVVERLRKLKGRLTVSDAAAATGLALHEVQDAFDVLMNRYRCRLQVTESGEILYYFGSPLRRRGAKSAGEYLKQIASWCWKAFKALFKIWITVTLILYFVVFVIIVIALIISASSRSSGKGKGISLGWIGDLFADMFGAAARGGLYMYTTDRYGYKHKSYRQTKRKDPKEPEAKKRFVQSVYDFVFGPPRPEFDPLANAREAAAYLRESKGVMTISEVVALAGYRMETAEERFTDYLTRFGGRPEITGEGVVYGTFDRLLATTVEEGADEKIELFWEEYEAPFLLTGNTAGRNVFIVFANGFNLIMSLFFASGELSTLFEGGMPFLEGSATVLLGWIPFVFSLLLFAIPLLRVIPVWRRETLRRERNVRRRITRAIYESRGAPLSLDSLAERVNHGTERQLAANEIEGRMTRLLRDLEGRMELDDAGTVLYTFPRIERESRATEDLRSDRKNDTPTLGTIIAEN